MPAYINNFYGTYIEHIDTFVQGQDNIPQRPQPMTQEPHTKNILPTPREGKYTEVRRYIDERTRFDEEFKVFVRDHSLRDLCARLTKEFGWFVDENSLQRNLNRNR